MSERSRADLADGTEASGEVTAWLQQWAQGEPTALDRLAPLVYEQLRVIADNLLRNESSDHTLQATALVNETFLKLLDVRKVTLNDRSHFFAFAARLMRRVLIDHARRLKAGKRSVPGFLPLDSELAWTESLDEVALDLNVAIQELEGLDSSAVRALELRYFLGCTGEETAALLGVSPSTIDRSLRFSLAWLHGRLHPKS
jgi:RNA polymerase sigma factor (TIGR02999 family)